MSAEAGISRKKAAGILWLHERRTGGEGAAASMTVGADLEPQAL
jgi:hypothetical protein